MRNAYELLKLLTDKFPPGQSNNGHPMRHAIVLNDDQSQHNLTIALMLGDRWQEINIDEQDLAKSPQEIFDEIVSILPKQ
jgi:hypothetical protein